MTDEEQDWTELVAEVGVREAYRVVRDLEELFCVPYWSQLPLNSDERRHGWLIRQQIDGMCKRISAGHARP